MASKQTFAGMILAGLTVDNMANIDGRKPNHDVLQELYESRWVVFDTLPTFFEHEDPWVELGRFFFVRFNAASDAYHLAAFEVYVRRAYRAYTVLAVDYEEGDGLGDGESPSAVTWKFKLGQSSSPPSTPRLGGFGHVTFFVLQLVDVTLTIMLY
jgi:acetyl-CoA carboxylase / biotin carboxylase 1